MARYPGLDYRPVLRPLIDCPELAVHVVTTRGQVDLPEGTPSTSLLITRWAISSRETSTYGVGGGSAVISSGRSK